MISPISGSLPSPDELKVLEIRTLCGPNLWSDAPLIECRVDLGGWDELSSELLPGFNERLLEWLPGLMEHRCSVGERGGFVQRLNRGTYPAHIMEHLTIELHSVLGVDIWYGRTRHAGQDRVYRVVFKYKEETLARSCFLAAREIFLAAALDLPFDVGECLKYLGEVAERCLLPAEVRALIDAAARRDIPHIRVGNGQLVQFGHGARQRRMIGMATDRLGAIASTLADDRELLENQLLSAGVSLKLADPDEPSNGLEYRLLMIGRRLAAALENKRRDVTEEVHSDFADAAAEALSTLQWEVASIDIRAEDIRSPLASQKAVIVKLQPQAELGIHLRPAEGKPRPVDEAMLELLFAKGENSRIPIVAIGGSRGKTITARLLAHIFQGTRNCVGIACSDGVYIYGQQIGRRNGNDAGSARGVLLHPRAEIAIFETDCAGILSEGLAFDQCHLAVITNIGEVADAERVAEIASTIVRVVNPQGVAVLNAADPLAAGMAKKCKGRVLYFAPGPADPIVARHRSDGGQAVFVRDGVIVSADGTQEKSVLHLNEVPFTSSGIIGFQVENLLAAIGAATALGVPDRLIAARARDFRP